MQSAKRTLAWMMTVAMLLTILPMHAFASEPDMVVYNLLDCPIRVGNDEEAVEAGELDALFEEDGSYTILLEDDALFPYEVQFTYGGETWEEWFMSAEDTVEIGGHTFAVSTTYTDPEALQSIGVWVGDDFVQAYPEKKEFTEYPQMSTFSLLPLREKSLNLDLSEYLPWELQSISVDAVTGLDSIDGNIAAWAKWGYYDESNRYVSSNDDYVCMTDGTVNLSGGMLWDASYTMELIVGTADQLNPDNVRYRVHVQTSGIDNMFKASVYTAEDPRAEIDVYGTDFHTYRFTDNTITYGLEIVVDGYQWNGTQGAYLGLDLNELYKESISATVYAGLYHTLEEIPADAEDITAQIWDQQNLAVEGGRQYEEDDGITVVLAHGENKIAMPIELYMVSDSMRVDWHGLYEIYDYGRTSVCNSIRYEYPAGYDHLYTFELDSGYAVDGTYHLVLAMEDPTKEIITNCGLADVKKAVVGYYDTEADIPAEAEDIKDQLFSYFDGYAANYSNGVDFTIVDVKNGVHHIKVKVRVYEETGTGTPGAPSAPSAPDPLSQDTYFHVNGADELEYYTMPYDVDSYYYNGYQTVFLMEETYDSTQYKYVYSPVTDEQIIPSFYTGNKVTVYAGHDGASGTKQESDVTAIPFEHGKAVHYSAAAENGTHLKNYWVTFLTQQQGAELFVNGATNSAHKDENGTPVREVFLNDEYDNHHDIFFANVGDEALTGLYVKLEDAENIKLDEYWTIRDGSSLSAFTTLEDDDPDGYNTSYGELPNVGKVRLVADGNDGVISGKLTIGSDNGGEVTIQLTGLAGNVEIVTDTIVDGVRYVPYSSLIQTNNMYAPDSVQMQITNGTLPKGVVLRPDGELYGVPQVTGEFDFEVEMTCTMNGVTYEDSRYYTLVIKDNTNANVWNETDTNYDVTIPVGTQGADYEFVLQNYEQSVFESQGTFAYFLDFWMDGQKLVEGTDYTAEEGSTKITIFAGTFQNAGRGTHTIAAEFREGDPVNGPLKRAAQNYTINASWSGSDDDDDDDYTPTPKPQKPAEPQKPVETNKMTFTDVAEQAWYYNDVKWAFEKEYMLGVSGNKFDPDAPVSQATIVTILARMAKVDLNDFSENVYASIPDGKWYTNAAVWAIQSGLLPGKDFGGEDPISRGDMAIMLAKYLKRIAVDAEIPENRVLFDDADLMTEEVNDAFQILFDLGVFKGVGGVYMDPVSNTSRAQFAALLHRLSDLAGLK